MIAQTSVLACVAFQRNQRLTRPRYLQSLIIPHIGIIQLPRPTSRTGRNLLHRGRRKESELWLAYRRRLPCRLAQPVIGELVPVSRFDIRKLSGGLLIISCFPDLNHDSVGMVDDEGSDWFVSGEKRPITFERRIPEIMMPCMKEAGLENMQPDLIVFSSLFWDESYIWRVSHIGKPQIPRKGADWESGSLALQHGMQVGHYNTDPTDGLHGFFPNELKWHRSRIQEFITYIRSMFGDDVPLMFRTRQHRAKNKWGGVLKIFQLDQSIRAVTRAMGVRYFTWGSKLEGWLK